MKTIKVKSRVITDKNVDEYIKTLTSNFRAFLEDAGLNYIFIDEDREVFAIEKEPVWDDYEECWSLPQLAVEMEYLETLPEVYEFNPKESLWKLDLN